jgi:hypothetical protein
MSNFKNWISDLNIGKCGNGWFVRIDGCDVFEDIQRGGNPPAEWKGRKTFSITEKLDNKEEATQAAKEWLINQLKSLEGID